MDGDAIEVEVKDEFGVTSWQKAKVMAVLIDGYFQAKITTKNDSWDDWFTWQEENKDWRRKRAPEPKSAASKPAASSKHENKRQPEKRAPAATSSSASSSKRERSSGGAPEMLRLDYSKMRLRVDRVKKEATLVPSASVSPRHGPLLATRVGRRWLARVEAVRAHVARVPGRIPLPIIGERTRPAITK